jgi:hypothetical protein
MKWDQTRLPAWLLGMLVAYAAVRSFFLAAWKPLWYDEVCTVVMSRQPSMASVWRALERGADSQPPPFYPVERFARWLIPNDPLAFRLPSILGFCGVVVCLFIFVRRRNGTGCALLCAALPLLSALYAFYAIEARGYSLMTACIALALVCYQRADDLAWVTFLGVSLAAAVSFQYYAIFALAPFVLAEAAHFFETRRSRPWVWLALGCGLVPLVIFWPLLSTLRQYYGDHFWAQPRLMTAMNAYSWLFLLRPPWGLLTVSIVWLGLLSVIVSKLSARRSPAASETESFLNEDVLVLTLVALPFISFLGTKAAHGGLTYRYMLPTILGVALAFGRLLPRLGLRRMAVFGVFVLCGLALQEVSFWRPDKNRAVSPAKTLESLINSAPALPIVVSDAGDYLQLVYYASPQLAARLVSLVDLPKAVAYSRSDTIDRQLLLLRSYIPLQQEGFQGFVAIHPKFLLYSGGGGWDWWPRRLRDDGYTLQLVAFHENAKVYLVLRGGATR